MSISLRLSSRWLAAFVVWASAGLAFSQTSDEAKQTDQRPNAGLSAIPYPWIVSHRGDCAVYPEHTMEAYRASVAAGAQFVEVDCFLLEDGSLGIMHDDTLNRTTNMNWPTSRMNRETWSRLEVIGEKLTPMKRGRYRAPMLDDVLREYGNKVVIFVEPKNPGAGEAIVAALKKNNISPDFVIVNSFSRKELEAALTADYITMLNLHDESQVPELLKSGGGGYDYINIPTRFNDNLIQDLTRAGIKLGVYMINRRYLREKYSKLNVRIMSSDDSIYVQDRPVAKEFDLKDPFASQSWFHGQWPTTPGRTGFFSAPNKWGMYEADTGTYAGCLQGWCSPINGGQPYKEFKLSLNITFGNSISPDRWASVFLSLDDRPMVRDDAPVEPVTGYHFLARKNGIMQVFQYTDGRSKLVGEINTESRIKTGMTALYEISYVDGWVCFTRPGSTAKVRFRDENFQIFYLTLGVKGLGADFSNVHVTAN